MKKFKLLTIISTLVLCLGMMLTPAYGAEYINIAEYKETFAPAADLAADLTVNVKATAGEDGYIYLIKTLENTTAVSVTGDNVAGKLEEYTQGGINYYRVKVNTAEETEITAKFAVAGFYPEASTAEDNGGANYAVDYTFTNHFDSEIGKYVVSVVVPEGHETVKVTTPAKYEKQKLDVNEDGLRTVGASGKVAPAATSGVAFTYNAPLSSMMNIVVWVVCLGIGGLVFIDRLKKAKQ